MNASPRTAYVPFSFPCTDGFQNSPGPISTTSTYKIRLDVQSRPRRVPSVAQRPAQPARWVLQHAVIPTSLKPSPAPSCPTGTKSNVALSGASRPPRAVPMSQISHQDITSKPRSCRRTQELCSTSEAHRSSKQRFNAGTHTRPQIQFGIAACFDNGGCLVSLASRGQQGGLGG